MLLLTLLMQTFVCLVSVEESISIKLPRMVMDMLSHVEDKRISFIDVFEMHIEAQTFSNSGDSQRERGNDGGDIVKLEDEGCRPRPVVVKIPQPGGENSFRHPFFVTLYRCQGGCGASSFVSRCKAVSIKPLQVQVAEISWNSETVHHITDLSRRITTVSMHNETRCSCLCHNDKPKCGQFQTWSQSTCRCECVVPCPANYIPDSGECCKCVQPKPCYGRHQWNAKTCKCECRRTKCRNRMKIRDENCRCSCQPVVCRYGGTQDQRSCLCRQRPKIKKLSLQKR